MLFLSSSSWVVGEGGNVDDGNWGSPVEKGSGFSEDGSNGSSDDDGTGFSDGRGSSEEGGSEEVVV